MREVLFILAVVAINRCSVKKPDTYLTSTKLSLNQVNKSQFFWFVLKGPIF